MLSVCDLQKTLGYNPSTFSMLSSKTWGIVVMKYTHVIIDVT